MNNEGINSKQLIRLIERTAEEHTKQLEFRSVEGVLNQLVIFVDEFDKLGTSFDSTGNWNKHVQANFLTLIEDKDRFSGVSWVFAGAFTSIYDKKSNSIGFFAEQQQEESNAINEKDILRAGIIPEMLGRISLIVQLDSFNKEDYRRVLEEKLLPKFSGLELDISKIVEKAFNSGQGIRSLIRQLETFKIDQEYKEIHWKGVF